MIDTRNSPSPAFRWGLTVPSNPYWVVTHWFRTRKQLEDYADSKDLRDYGVCRNR